MLQCDCVCRCHDHCFTASYALQAVDFIKGVLSVYDLGCRWMFTCGQQAYADYLSVSSNAKERQRIIDSTVNYGRHCRRIRGRFEVGGHCRLLLSAAIGQAIGATEL